MYILRVEGNKGWGMGTITSFFKTMLGVLLCYHSILLMKKLRLGE